jgi:hypothetical protein
LRLRSEVDKRQAAAGMMTWRRNALPSRNS